MARPKQAERAVDFTVQDDGTICILYPHTPAAKAWVDKNLIVNSDETESWGGGIVIEPRYLLNIINDIRQIGLEVR
jgi:hypothetical protein